MIPPAFRNLALTAHITASVGWLGAIAGFLALAISAQTSHDPQTVRASVIAMESIARVVILPLSLASLLTGLVQSLGTKWGLFRHYWVVGKLVINIFANVVLLMYMPTLGYLRDLAIESNPSSEDLELLRDPSPVLHSSAALVLLLVATVLAVYKPRGMTMYGWRKQQEQSKNIQGGSIIA